MEKVIECVQTGTNGVLESPTGTGKTLSLLCAALAFVQLKKAQMQAQRVGLNAEQLTEQINQAAAGGAAGTWGFPKIIYASRTHSQLTQAMGELKRTAYRSVKAAVIGSRDQLCIHPEVMSETGNAAKINHCRAKILSKSCSFYGRVESVKDSAEVRGVGILDIEDLIKVGTKTKCCPYFLSKELVEQADITFMPYNYLLDPKARKTNKICLENSIVILDEAHNVEKICEDCASAQLKSSDLAVCIDEIGNIMVQMNKDKELGLDLDNDEDGNEKSFTLEDVATLKEVLLNLERAIDDLKIDQKKGTTFGGDYMFTIFAKAGVTGANAPAVIKLLDDLIQYVTTLNSKGPSSATGALGSFSDVLNIVFAGYDEEFKERVRRSYKVHVVVEEEPKTSKYSKQNSGWTSFTGSSGSGLKKTAKILNYWCFNPGFGMLQLLNKNVHSIILTSGTLAPLNPLISELALPVSVRLENPHIIDKSQVCVRVVTHGPDREQLISNYENRDNPKYINSLGMTILSFLRITPGGTLVFFPSYFIMNKCQDAWQRSTLWAEMKSRKPIFTEPRTKEEFTVVMQEYYAAIERDGGACFMAVCRGKVSEGLDFADMNGRSVIITGLPFPPLMDPRVILKRSYLDQARVANPDLPSGQSWYMLEAIRATNQAMGRVIRHRNDWGAILLCDSRFADRNIRSQVSRWLQDHMAQQGATPNFGTHIGSLSKFFREVQKLAPPPIVRTIEPLKAEPVDGKWIQTKPSPSQAAVNNFVSTTDMLVFLLTVVFAYFFIF